MPAKRKATASRRPRTSSVATIVRELTHPTKPIVIKRAKGGFHVYVHGQPVLRNPDGKLTFDRKAAGLKHSPLTQPAAGAPTHTFKKISEAETIAHQIGRYVLGLGDFVFTYVEKPGAKRK